MLAAMGRPRRYSYAGAYHQLRSARTRLTPIAPGIISLGLEARGRHRTSTAQATGERNAISQDRASS